MPWRNSFYLGEDRLALAPMDDSRKYTNQDSGINHDTRLRITLE